MASEESTPTCKNCVFWGSWKKGACDKVGDMNATREPATLFDLQLQADDDSNLNGWLITGPDFGCIHFAAGDPQAEPDDNDEG